MGACRLCGFQAEERFGEPGLYPLIEKGVESYLIHLIMSPDVWIVGMTTRLLVMHELPRRDLVLLHQRI